MAPLPKYVKRQPDHAGRVRYYFRYKGVYQRLPDDPASAEFFARYAAMLAGTALTLQRPAEGTIAAVIADYKGSEAYKRLVPKTQRDYARQLDRFAPSSRHSIDLRQLRLCMTNKLALLIRKRHRILLNVPWFVGRRRSCHGHQPLAIVADLRYSILGLLCCVAILGVSTLRAENSCEGSLDIGPDSASILRMHWKGEIKDPMGACIMTAFAKVQSTVSQVSLSLDSPGGNLATAEEVVAALKHIRKTHQLSTIVWRGATCGSACIPVFLAGERRYGALASIWVFHEVGHWTQQKDRRFITDRIATERVFQDYFLTAGVSESWLNHLRLLIQNSDYWQTGQNLWDGKSGIFTHNIDNLEPRFTERRNTKLQQLFTRVSVLSNGSDDRTKYLVTSRGIPKDFSPPWYRCFPGRDPLSRDQGSKISLQRFSSLGTKRFTPRIYCTANNRTAPCTALS